MKTGGILKLVDDKDFLDKVYQLMSEYQKYNQLIAGSNIITKLI